jgi:uncharacterized protein (DUF169 family)
MEEEAEPSIGPGGCWVDGSENVQELLGLRRPPIAVGFVDAPPADLEPWSAGPVPAGCSFWQQAMEGRAFYTVLSDHYNCAVGSYTHGVGLPPERASELGQTLGLMEQVGYVAMAEVPGIPTLAQAPGYVAYAPVDRATFPPDVVVVAARPAQAMLLYEAALKAGAGDALTNLLGRPGCAVLPLTANSRSVALSFGCIGNRTFTGLGDDELYVCVPGDRWDAVQARLAEVRGANAAMREHYTAQQARFPVG